MGVVTTEKKPMQAFTVAPVWGLLIMQGVKIVENRSFRARPGAYLVHCSVGMSYEQYMSAADWIRTKVGPEVIVPRFEECQRVAGKVIGSIRVTGASETHASPWWDGARIAWELREPRPCRPVDARGFLGIWRATPELMERVKAARRDWLADKAAGRA